MKSQPDEEIAQGLARAARGEPVFSGAVYLLWLAASQSERPSLDGDRCKFYRLTPWEHDVMVQLAITSATSKYMATIVGRDAEAVQNAIQAACKKINVEGRTALALWARDNCQHLDGGGKA